ncbi:hypothetical protein P879_02107 [Paragonimus westermani]|uniref:Par3/HAL N-terminal domain-containing protein n=1 Tax=Paragonimus westermani TaxID=34504 RepID=A0A8T0DXB1_9TREM|nr:hypothetical protein P879_02107 [Paragonimus westermani]
MMKLTVCFGDSKVVVPCGDGVLTIRELALNALRRARHTFPKLDVRDRIVVHNVTIARDGGILDWDDLVRDVLDDRELVTAHYSIATLAVSPVCAEVDRSNLPRNDQLFRHLCTPLVIDLCSDSGTSATSAHSVIQSNEASGSGESAASGGGGGACLADCPPASHSNHRCLHSLRVAVGDEGNHSSGSSLSLNMSTGSFSGATQGVNARTWRLVDTIGQTTTKSDFCEFPFLIFLYMCFSTVDLVRLLL